MGEFNATKYKNEFIKEKYDRLNIQVPKGKKEIIEAHRKKRGFNSLNSYINNLIDKDIEQEKEAQRVPETDGGG